MKTAVGNLETHPLHLGRGATAVPPPPFTGMDWYQGYAERHDADGPEGRLVTMYRFTTDWDSWEMHPAASAPKTARDDRYACLTGVTTVTPRWEPGSLPSACDPRASHFEGHPILHSLAGRTPGQARF
ncbi:MAG: hypothetical protein ABI668_00285 [Sphingorhabdus sp.]